MTRLTRIRRLFGRLRRSPWLGRELPAFVLAGAVAGAITLRACPGPGLTIASFNIRQFPETERQIAGAFATIEALDVPLVAVQEINDPARFAEEARRHLGVQWRAEFGLARGEAPEGDKPLLTGLLYDAGLYSVDFARLRRETKVAGNGRATLEVRLWAPRGPDLHVFVVHLKAGGHDDDHRQRLLQLRALAEVIDASTTRRERVIVLGDFNATREDDRVALAQFAARTGLDWTTRELACTAYWLPDGRCDSSALDHVFASRPARAAAARGPCEAVGCEPGEQCPIFYDEVSDHCPITASW